VAVLMLACAAETGAALTAVTATLVVLTGEAKRRWDARAIQAGRRAGRRAGER
jgi:hypothetical protein